MLDRFRQRGPFSDATIRWRTLGGLFALLLGIAVSIPRALEEPQSLLAIGLIGLVISGAWLWIAVRTSVVSVGLLGAASTLLMVLLPGPGPVIGVIAAIVTAAMRLPAQIGLISSVVLGLAFVLADGFTSRTNSPASVALTALGLAFAYVGGASVRRIREERETARALLTELQRTREAQIEAAALGERSRLAREIHDVLAHTLSALAVQLEGTRMLLEQRPGDPAAVAAVERAHRLARDGLDETRRAVAALRGDLLPGPEALGRLANDFLKVESESETTPCTFVVEGDPTPLDPEAQLALYRTAQEALTNVHKHARATSVEMRLRYLPDGTELLIEDIAPVGPPDGRTNGGYGLIGMRERAELVGGTLEAGPLPTGFRVRLWLPKR